MCWTARWSACACPRRARLVHADELWRHTCFEAFLRSGDGPAYYELNASPSTEWALYSFESYRKAMAPAASAPAPRVDVHRAANRLQVDVELDLRTLSRPRALALAAVIEDENARLSYWALKHPAAEARLPSSRRFRTRAARMKFGIDRLLADAALRKPLAGKRVALLAHPASVTANLTHSLDALAALGDVRCPPPSGRSTACAATSRTTWSSRRTSTTRCSAFPYSASTAPCAAPRRR